MADTFPSIQHPSGLEETRVDPTIRSEMESGIVATRPRYTRIRKSWTLTWANLRGADYFTLSGFYDDRKGGSLPFSWTNSKRNATYTVRFKGDISAKYTDGGCWNVSLTLEEL